MIIAKEGDAGKLADYLRVLKEEDPLARSLLEAYFAIVRSRFPEAARKGRRLLSRVSGDSRLVRFLFNTLGMAYRGMGELEASDNYILKALEISERIGYLAINTKINLLYNRLLRAEYESIYSELAKLNLESATEAGHHAGYLLAIVECVRGRPDSALRRLTFLSELSSEKILWCQCIEIKGLANRLMGKLEEARRLFIESAEAYAGFSSAYSAFPCAKALELSRFAGLEPPPGKLIRRCLALARRGSWGEQAAAQEIDALLEDDDFKASEGLYDAAVSYSRANQPIEAFLVGATAALLAWRTNSPIFPIALKFIAPLAPLHRGFRRDPILGSFLSKIEPLLSDVRVNGVGAGIRANLIASFEIWVNGREIRPFEWYNKKAVRALVYLLLSPKHRLARDHLFYLLWPRKKYIRKNAVLLYEAVSVIRRNLGDRTLLVRKHDFYQLEGDVWTDLGEMESLIRLADSCQESARREELLARARELARGELLPEFPYDPYIDEYRQYYERLRRKVGGNKRVRS